MLLDNNRSVELAPVLWTDSSGLLNSSRFQLKGGGGGGGGGGGDNNNNNNNNNTQRL